jgi:hypothetical protein
VRRTGNVNNKDVANVILLALGPQENGHPLTVGDP